MRLYVPLDWQEFEALQRLALQERRRPQDQAAVILARALECAPDEAHRTGILDVEAPGPLESREAERVPA